MVGYVVKHMDNFTFYFTTLWKGCRFHVKTHFYVTVHGLATRSCNRYNITLLNDALYTAVAI